jgi:glutathione S-transferase
MTMRFMVIVKASQDSEAGTMPTTEMLAAMGKFNEEMAKAGVIEAGEGLHPTVKGARVGYTASGPGVTRGPFDLSRDLIAGFWLIKTSSLDEAIGWMKRAPFGPGSEIEIRQVLAAEDFGEAFTPELREQEERTRAQAAKA